MTPADAGTLTVSDSGLDCTVDWLATFTGQAELKVKGINDCGEGDYSELLAVNVANTYGIGENGSGLSFGIYPNPSRGNFRIEVTTDKSSRATLRMFTSTGEPAWGPVVADIYGKLALPVNAAALPDGIYLLQIETNMGISYRKIIIKK
jgi:hypothetical protein